MRRLRLILWTLLCVGCFGVLGITAQIALLQLQAMQNRIIPTLAQLPSATASPAPTLTSTATWTWTPSPTSTATGTPIPSPTLTPAERVLVITAIMPGVTLPPVATEIPSGMTVLDSVSLPVEPLIEATRNTSPFYGWQSFESDNPAMRYEPAWTPRLSAFASQGQYHRTDAPNSRTLFAFEGEALRVRYVAASNMGIFQITVDGVIVDEIDAFAPELSFPVTSIYPFSPGSHLLEIRATGRKNRASEGAVIGLDAVHVYRADENTVILPPAFDVTPTRTPRFAQFELIAAPPTVQPTASPVPPRKVSATVVIAYDENGNRAADTAEGVRGITVRAVDLTTNRPLASSVTDANGFAALELETDAPIQIVVPYFDKVWNISRGRSGGTEMFTLLLPAANQPGLIP